MTRQTDNLQTLIALAAQFPATLARIMERDSEKITMVGDWFAPVGADVCHTASRNHGWEGAE